MLSFNLYDCHQCGRVQFSLQTRRQEKPFAWTDIGHQLIAQVTSRACATLLSAHISQKNLRHRSSDAQTRKDPYLMPRLVFPSSYNATPQHADTTKKIGIMWLWIAKSAYKLEYVEKPRDESQIANPAITTITAII